MPKYSKKAQNKIAQVMREFERGELKSSSGNKVKDRDQAQAIALSEARQEGYKVPSQNRKGRKKSDTRSKSKAAGSYESRTKEQLYELAKERNIEGRSKMSKQELIKALRKNQ